MNVGILELAAALLCLTLLTFAAIAGIAFVLVRQSRKHRAEDE